MAWIPKTKRTWPGGVREWGWVGTKCLRIWFFCCLWWEREPTAFQETEAGGSWWAEKKVTYPWKKEEPPLRVGTCSEGLKRSLSKLCSSHSRFSLWTLSLHRSLSTVWWSACAEASQRSKLQTQEPVPTFTAGHTSEINCCLFFFPECQGRLILGLTPGNGCMKSIYRMNWAGSIYRILERFLFKPKNAHEYWDKPFEMVQKCAHRKLLIVKEKCRLEMPMRKAGPQKANLDISCFWNFLYVGLALFVLLPPFDEIPMSGHRLHSQEAH